MSGRIRFAGLRASLVAVLIVPGIVFFSSSVNAEGLTLHQCANGGINDPVDHLECHEGWISGNANQNKAAYAEGEFLPSRVTITGLTVGSLYTYEFSWDILHSGLHALDYIGTYNHNVTNANACQGLSASICAGGPNTTAIPADPTLGFAPIPGNMTLFGGVLSPIAVGDYTSPAADERGIKVSFTPSQSTVVLTWGAHISSPVDWGDGNTASDINGSPYHQQNKSLKNSLGEVVASGGQDIQLSAAAVFVPAAITVTKTANTAGTFSFESFREGMALPPDGESNPWTLQTGQSKVLNPMDDGTMTITETALPSADWRINSIICSEIGMGEIFSYVFGEDPPTDTAEFEIVEAGTYECVFDNEFTGAPVINVIKKVIGPTDDCTDAVRDGAGNESRSIQSGESVKYCYWANNTGSDDALDVTIEDDMGTGSTADDVFITLSGGSDIDGQADDPDLSTAGEYVYGELVKAHNIALGTTITNVATAVGTGKIDGLTYDDTDDASVTADIANTCSINATVTTGTCPGVKDLVVLINDTVNWCADISWPSTAILDLTNINIALLTTAVSTTNPDLSPGDSEIVEVGSTTATGAFTGTLRLTGSEGGLNDIQCDSNAMIDTVDPGIMLTKHVSTDNVCDAGDTDMATIFLGEPVWYCLTIENTGDADLVNVTLDDPTLGISGYNVGSLAAGADTTVQFGPYYPSADVENTAYVEGTEPQTDTDVDDEAMAFVDVLSADIEVDKDVDPGTIVICLEGNPSPLCSEPNLGGTYDTHYTITVTNNGPDTAFDVSVDDELPFGFIYDSDDGGCVYDGPSHSLDCFIGDMDPLDEVVINVWGEIDPSLFPFPWVSVTNQACANPDPPEMDPNPSNNCDEAETDINTGPTRTIGYWGTHPHALNACMDLGPVDLGYVSIQSEKSDDEIDATVSTALSRTIVPDPRRVGPSDRAPTAAFSASRGTASRSGHAGASLMTPILVNDDDAKADSKYEFAKGIINANPAQWKNSTKRSDIDRARIKASRQLTAAWCNELMAGGVFAEFFFSWEDMRTVLAGQGYIDGDMVVSCGGPCDNTLLPEVIASIEFIASIADLFNNAGDSLDVPIPPAPADPHAPEDDPTDPSD